MSVTPERLKRLISEATKEVVSEIMNKKAWQKALDELPDPVKAVLINVPMSELAAWVAAQETPKKKEFPPAKLPPVASKLSKGKKQPAPSRRTLSDEEVSAMGPWRFLYTDGRIDKTVAFPTRQDAMNAMRDRNNDLASDGAQFSVEKVIKVSG